MYRRGFLVLAAGFVGLALWLGMKDFTVTSGNLSSNGPRTHTCGSTIGVLFMDEYAPGIEGSFLRPRCWYEARDRSATQAFLVVMALGATIVGFVRGPAPPLRSIHELTPLPTVAELRRSRFRVVDGVDDRSRP